MLILKMIFEWLFSINQWRNIKKLTELILQNIPAVVNVNTEWQRQLLEGLKGQTFDVFCGSRCDNSLAIIYDG